MEKININEMLGEQLMIQQKLQKKIDFSRKVLFNENVKNVQNKNKFF